MESDTLRSEDEASERRFWGMVLRVLWTVVIVLVVAGVLASLTVALQWTPYRLLGAVGLLAGASLLLALLGSARSRELTGFVLGAIALPLLAVWLAGLAATNPDIFTAYGAGLAAFLAHAAGAVGGGIAIARVWRERPGQRQEAPAGVSPAPKEGGMP
jgi:membrane associated rhomboid family serine protease